VETSLLKTKLNVPPARPQTVPRPHLIERLQEGLQYSLILVSAPAGFGKTTLVSEWARHSRISTAWVSLDEGDNDPVRFWDYFIAALKTIRPDTGEIILPLLHSSQPLSPQIPVESLLTALINDISGISGDYFIALDDYHVIESEQVHDGVNYLLEHMPANMHLAIATREDPALPLARFRGKGTMLEIGADDLRFTVEDAVLLLSEMKIPDLSDEEVNALNERTEGWVAGLKMAALSMSDREDIPTFITDFTGSHRYVMDYLMEEVLHKQSDKIRDFLLKTSVLERLCGPLCDAVTSSKGSQDILGQLERGHLFIVALDKARKWYRYEHLFSDILRHQLEATHSTGDINELHRRAGRWYEDNHFRDEAIRHSLTAEDWGTAATLIKTARKFESGDCFILLNWLQRLPITLLESDMQLCTLYCTALIYVNDFEMADIFLNHIEQSSEPDDLLLQGELASLRCVSAYKRRNYLDTLEFGNKTLTLLPKDYGYLRNQVLGFMALIHWGQGNIKKAEELFSEQYSIALYENDLFEISATLWGLGDINIVYGRLQQAVDYLLKASQSGEWIEFTSRAHGDLASIFYEWNDLVKADFHSHKAIEAANISHVRTVIPEANYQLALNNVAQGRQEEAKMYFNQAEANTLKEDTDISHAVRTKENIRFALLREDLSAAITWSKLTLSRPEFQSYKYDHIPIRLLIAQGKNSDAEEKLRDMYERAVQSGAQYLMIIYRVYQSLVAETEESAIEYLSEALVMAEPEGYIRTFVDEGKLLKPLLEKALSRGITPEYTRKLIGIIEAEERQKLKRKRAEGAPTPHQTILSERELEVLRLMAEGLSNQQIAERLFISLSTAKNHIHNIIDKLEVKGRTQAVTQARELELI
jgi:LuxR family maltose regulon positive regulatory protein